MAKKKYEDYLKELQNLPINDKQEDNAINNKKEIAPTRTTIAQKNISAPVWEKNNNIAPMKNIKQNEEQFKQEQENYESKKTKEDYLKELQNLKFDSDKEKKKIFDAGAFEDGYQFGDVTKTILGTGANALSAAGQGMMGISDAAAKLVVGGVAQVADWTGNTEYATKLRDRIAGKDEVTNERLKKYTPLGWFESAKEATDKDSVLGEASQDLLNGVGYYGGMSALQAVGVPWQVTAGTTAAGSELSNAYANDAEDWEAWTSAVVSALAEIGTEYISGGVKLPGTGKTMEKLTGNLVNNIKNKYLKGAFGFGINMFGEGFEEDASGIVSEMTRRLTYMKDEEKGLIENALNGAKDYMSQQALSDFVNGSIVAGLTMGVNPGTYKNIKTGRSLITGLTTEEQNKIQQEVDNVIKERTENGETITNKEINAIEEEVKNEILNETYNNQEDITDNLEEFNQQQQELKTQQQNQENNQRIENIENQVNQINEELQNSSFNYDPNAKRYNDLQNTNTIEFNTKDNGNIKVALKDSKNNLINEISLDNKENAIKELGNDIGNYIVNNATNKPQNIEINKTINNNENVENNSPKSFKEQQLDIIKETNPMEDENHVGIRNVNDIKTFEEAINDDESFAWGDYTKEDAIRDLNKGSVMVYSSKPIVNGNFVSTSYQQAYEYAGHDKSKVYSKEVPINEVAWINGDEGQYAKVNSIMPSQTNDSFPYNEETYKKYSNMKEMLNTESENMINNYDGKINVENYIQELNNIDFDNLTENEAYTKALEIINKYNQDRVFINNGKKIVIRNGDIDECIHKIFGNKYQKNLLKEHLQVFSDIGDIIEHAKIKNQEPEGKNRPNYESWHYFVDGLEIAGNKYMLEFDVVSRKDGENHYRVQRLVDLNAKEKAMVRPTLPLKGEAGLETTAYDNNNTINNSKSQIAPLPSQYNMQQDNKNIQNNEDIVPIKETKELPKNPTTEEAYEKKATRSEIQNELLKDMGITIEDLEKGKDINAIGYQRTDPIRLNEKVFGAEIGNKINDATIRKTNHNEAERTRFLNKEREEIKNLGIKPRSEESAAVQKYGEKQYVNLRGKLVKYGDTELAKEFPDVATQNKIKNAAKFIRNKYDSYIDEINKSITEMGYDPIPKRQDYMRHFQELDSKLNEWGIPLNKESLSKDALPTDINGITDQFKPGKNWFASTLQRKGIKTTYDAITGIDGYLEGASNLIYHTEDIQRYRSVAKLVRNTFGQTHGLDNVDLNTKEGRKRLNDIFDNKLSKYAAWLDEQANALAGKKGGIDRAAERLLGRKVYTILDSAKKQVGSNMTGFNVRSALTNFASAVQGASKTNKMSFVKGTISTIKNMINNDGLIDKSDFLTNRFGSDQLSKKLWQKASNAGQILMTGTDYFTANQIWRSKYFENLSKGMNEQQAIKKADDFASRIMGDRSKGMTAEIFNSKTLGLLTQFQLEVNNQWSSIVHDNKMDLQRGNKSGASVIFQLGQLAAMSFMFNNFMKAMTGSDVMIDPIDMLRELFGANDDDDEETTLEERSQKVLGDIVNNLPFASFMTGGRIPISEAFTGVGTLGKKLTGQKDQFGNDISWDDVKDDAISSAFYWLLPTGYGQLKKTSKGISMYNEELPLPGSYTNSGNLRFAVDDTPGDRIKAALFGEYSSKEAQKYRDSGYKTINASKIDLLKELNMSSSEFRKIQDKISEASETTTKKDGVTYNKYFDNDGKTYWYNKDSKKLYDENFNVSNKNVLNLEKAEKNELLFDYISDSYLNEQQKQKLFHEYFTNTTTDQYGFEKYTDEKNKTYWYDKDKQTLYDSKYNIVKDKKISSLKKVNKEKDLTNYNDYGSYEEANFAITEPGKYLTSKTTTNSYKKYKKYTEDIANISADKDKNGKSIPNSKKKKVIEYISNLNEDYGSKIILYKMYYPKDNSYNSQIIKYLNSLDSISDKDERTILKYLGMKVSDDGTVRW